MAVFLFLVVFGGCEELRNQASDDTGRFIGTWNNETAYPALIQFSSDGSCLYGGEIGTWTLQDNKVAIQLPDLAITHYYNYWFSENDQTLLLTKTFGYSILYTKQ